VDYARNIAAVNRLDKNYDARISSSMARKINLRKARWRVGESQQEFAARLGVDQSTYSRWENGMLPTKGPARVTIEYVLADIAIQRSKAKA
jgi:DNA-binding transcriptional regulator YiaG